MTPPVILWLFNRPHLTARVFAAIREARPAQLFLIADGPRPDHPDDVRLCAAARAQVAHVDWPCAVERDFSDVNLGIRRRILSGLDRAFDAVDEAIILEDDILPDATFFRYCAELLDRYRNQDQVRMVSGYNGVGCWPAADDASYFFTRYGAIWGWATWRRAWRRNDPDLSRFSGIALGHQLARHCPDPELAAHFGWRVRRLARRPLDSWDMPWLLSVLLDGGLCAIPRTNLVRHLDFGPSASHARNPNDPRDLPTWPAQFPLRHPTCEPEDAIDPRFVRWNHFMHLMSRYQDLHGIEAWAGALARQPALPVPTRDPEAAFALLPLRHCSEALAVLEHVEALAPQLRGVADLAGMFRRLRGRSCSA